MPFLYHKSLTVLNYAIKIAFEKGTELTHLSIGFLPALEEHFLGITTTEGELILYDILPASFSLCPT